MPDLHLTQGLLEVLADEPNPNLDLTQTPLQWLVNEAVDLAVSQLAFLVAAPTEQWLPHSGATITCFEIFPTPQRQPALRVTQLATEILAEPEADAFVCNGIEGTTYPSEYGSVVDIWEVDNVTKTFHCPVVPPEAMDEGGISAALYSAGEELPFSGQKRTITLIYHTVDNPNFYTVVIGEDEAPANLGFTNSATSKRVHFNISEIQNLYLEFWSSTGTITGTPPDLVAEFSGEISIECIQIEARDWASVDESLLVVYDD